MTKYMLNLTNFFKKNKVLANESSVDSKATKLHNWYDERYDTVVVQRNIALLVLGVLLILSICAIMTIAVVINAKKFDPFVIQVDETTGMAKIVTPIQSDVLEGADSLARYFIKKYLIARETYNPVDFDTQARQTIRLFSASSLFWNYMMSLKNEETNPSIVYGQRNSTSLTVKSWSKLDPGKYLVRFAVKEAADKQLISNKIAVIQFKYVPMELTNDERDINPVGFQIQAYRVDDDNS